MDVAAFGQGLDVVGGETQRGVVVREGSDEILLLIEDAGTADIGVRVRRVELDGAAVVGKRAVVLAARNECSGAIEEGERAVRVERDRAIIVGDRALEIALHRVEVAARHVNGCALRGGELAASERLDETRAGTPSPRPPSPCCRN